MKIAALKKKKGFTLIELMVVIAILASLAAIGYGPIIDHMNDGDRQMAQSNLKSMHTMLQGFKTANNGFPSDATAEAMEQKMTDNDINFGPITGETSNAYFRQLFVSDPKTSEKTFFAKISCNGKSIAEEGDNKKANGRALEKGENAMGYVMKKVEDPDNPNAKGGVQDSSEPLAICGVFPSNSAYTGDTLVFDMSSFRGHAFVLMVDGSVKDLEKKLKRDDNNDEKGKLTDVDSLFPESSNGSSTSGRYVVLSPEL